MRDNFLRKNWSYKLKKILQIGMTSNYGGIESFLINVYRNINKEKFQFDFLDMELNGKEIAYSDEIKKLGGRIYKIPGRRESFRNNKKELKKILINNDYDFVHNNILTWSYSNGITLPLKYTHSKVIVHSHNSSMNESMKARKMLDLFNRRLNYKDNLIRLACSKEAGVWLFNKKKFKVIPNGIETSKFEFNVDVREEYRKKFNLNNKKVFLHVGRLSHQKNHKYLFEIFEQILKKEKNSCLVLVGDGELYKELNMIVKEKNLEKNVIFLGTRHDVYELMCMSDVFLFPSFYEGLPVVLVEAQATGLPCLVSDNISNEINITNYINRMNINDPASKNAALALNLGKADFDREKGATLVKDAGYDISNTVNMLEKIYSNRE